MKKPIIIANWKMNPNSQKEAASIFEGIKNGAEGANAEVVVCPPFAYLPELKGLILGAQNMYFEEKGAYTGEISASMLKDLGCQYVIIGHSERRKYFNETDETANKKIKSAMSAGLEQIFCIGETEEEKNSHKEEEVVESQIKEGLKGISDILGIVIAYEPVWAIGTGNACGIEDAKKMKEFIEKKISDMYGKDALKEVRIVYGGSVNSQNASDYLKKAGYNGFLVGGASLKPDEFVKIIKESI
ncbi:MAG: triose-phosphate isomerase [Candidatus Nealsonbacteria bacterium]|nr:triose-phosphate isomerase [Candidatus Nealsonbacteria bacterium]